MDWEDRNDNQEEDEAEGALDGEDDDATYDGEEGDEDDMEGKRDRGWL